MEERFDLIASEAGEQPMAGWRIFIVRAILGILFGVLLSRFFFPRAPVIFTVGLCLVLVALAYFSEYLRRNKR